MKLTSLEGFKKIMFLIIEKKEETTSDFSQNSGTVFDMYKNGNSKDCKSIKWF